jgi:two-component sensor histidine kinase/CheY-like chemotaxis protein
VLIGNDSNPGDNAKTSAADGSSHTQALVNILIVDDEPKNLTVLEAILDAPGYRLVRAGSAEEALLALLADEFALLILDVRLPGVTGFELAEMIRERKKTARMPIIFLTAYYNEDQHITEGYDAGAVDYLHKPVNPAVLRSKVSIFAELFRKQRHVEEVNRALLAEVSSRRRAEEQLRELNNTLEQRVAERTASLHSSTERIKYLLKEVDHRSRNILSVVKAIARQTATSSPDDFMARFSERIQALAASHDLLVKSQWQGVEISDLIRAHLAHFNDLLDDRIKLDGPSFRLSVAAAQTFGMIMHELATNAAKYGALSNDSGHVDVRWRASDVFTISWIECDGPTVVAPTRRGFGSTVVKTLAESGLDGDIDLDFPPTGLRWRAACPLSKVLEKSAHRGRESDGHETVAEIK